MSRGAPKKVSELLNKAKESALLAVDIYNKPQTSFKSSGFIVLMCIAWTSLLHSIFEKQKTKYFYRKKDSIRFEKIDGENKAWELKKCAKEFFKDENHPIYKNIVLFYELRNKIEHRFLPEIDSKILSECQAFILGFEKVLVEEFGDEYTLLEGAYIPLQLSYGMRKLPKTKESKNILSFIENYRNSLSTDIVNSQDFAYKIYVMPNVGNHRNSSDAAINFIKIDEKNPEEIKKYNDSIIAIKQQKIQVANQGQLKPSMVVAKIKEKTGAEKKIYWHTQMWKKYKVRESKDTCNTKYCQYDEPHKDYIYTEKWVSYLIQEENLNSN
ncbi:DUF3644 domain-containing protein [Bathymodiolus thermophilus thioautotrophic gill symbiont]|uniref:DUF3644 domain-containing protein n=1 Tax=Bathymodiolus thermophilus thioautotrophic gill symbiont TaxID=2360 RepID=A0A1J5TXL0_9GAMM|nr:DUF3644 domain-containing protein [Bathymodiolus thermophilus thioautotrophic gill symbiont]OIR25490.1 hypothetical protein BGC33_06745 [Bathymodiolus thermophilus thioautotrophic gill symbiont]